ncbi:probable serine/threonine-protein kinase At1g54610 [Salvia splendens]|uniref:probable serine/threonine-protein kinase At1g54610 n=1 Tax=Salvia splendens TaxID=180675 RepID=UPI001C2610D1|nr:probable serine/threonine-protein kinase At1g54610 [Salvia splendens]
MGCVFGKQESSSERARGYVAGKGEGRDSRRRDKVVVGSVNTSKSEGEAVSVVVDGSQVPNGRDKNDERKEENARQPRGERRRSWPNPRLSNPPKNIHGEQVAAGWPSWLSSVAGEAINGWTPRRADSFVKIDKIGQGTYSNVYKAKDAITGKVVALKKVRFDKLEPESVRFMAREILILRRLDHPNVVKLQGLATSRMSCSLYLVFDYMEHDLAGLVASPGIKFTEPQVKCYMNQLLSGLEHCHNRHVLHRDIKGSNLLIDDGGVLKIADFGLASTFDPNSKQPMTSRVVTLWYRPPELLLGATHYGEGIDLWSAGCILAELFAGKPIITGRTEVEQLHRIFKLCGSPSEEYWKKSKLPHATTFKPQQSYKRCIRETFKDFPQSALSLIDTLLAIDPSERQTATAALKSEFFTAKPYACEPSSLPKYPPSKEMDARRRDEEARRLRAAGKTQADGAKKPRARERATRGAPAPEANAELQANIDRRRLISYANAKSKSEKFPPPHQDGGLGYPVGASQHLDPTYNPPNVPLSSTNFSYPKDPMQAWSGPLADPAAVGAPRRRPKPTKKDSREDKD